MKEIKIVVLYRFFIDGFMLRILMENVDEYYD